MFVFIDTSGTHEKPFLYFSLFLLDACEYNNFATRYRKKKNTDASHFLCFAMDKVGRFPKSSSFRCEVENPVDHHQRLLESIQHDVTDLLHCSRIRMSPPGRTFRNKYYKKSCLAVFNLVDYGDRTAAEIGISAQGHKC